MADTLPEFDRPPVVETVMSVQFEAVHGLTGPLVGWYWRECLGADWPITTTANPIADQFEDRNEARLLFRFPTGADVRHQITHRDDERMVQIQGTRFLYNWRRRRVDDYPSYNRLRPEFDRRLEGFLTFVRAADIGEPELNQWEMTYVNHIEKGDLWKTPSDWGDILTCFSFPSLKSKATEFERFGGEWHFVIEPERGRLHVAAQHGRAGSPSGPEVLVLKLTARGPLDKERGWTIDSGFELGHETIVRSFVEMTSPKAHKYWGRTA